MIIKISFIINQWLHLLEKYQFTYRVPGLLPIDSLFQYNLIHANQSVQHVYSPADLPLLLGEMVFHVSLSHQTLNH